VEITLTDRLGEIRAEPVDWRFRCFPATGERTTIGELADRRWNALTGDLLLPVMVLKESALAHNVELMARYCRAHGVDLAPHGKTPMAPQLALRQLEAGAWGITAATVAQVRVFRSFGVGRILLANELVDTAGLRWVADELAADPAFDFLCLADSAAGVARMGEALARAGRPALVLVELGMPGRRAGCRSVTEARAVAEAVASTPALELAGVEGYEGLSEDQDEVDRFLGDLRELTEELDGAGLFAGRGEIVVSAGGSAWLDRVVEILGGGWRLSAPVRVVLRSGSYLTHDSVHYERISPFGTRIPGERLCPALEAWGAVLSLPEPGRAIVGFGKRDVPYDLDLPLPRLMRSAAGELRSVDGELTVTELNDQHAFVSVADGFELAVGDLVGCGISHPCTAFDKWPLLPVVDDDYTVVDAVRTYF
jgi:D-serine deaminase-like pyridoxal phosphate-dependent protein